VTYVWFLDFLICTIISEFPYNSWLRSVISYDITKGCFCSLTLNFLDTKRKTITEAFVVERGCHCPYSFTVS